MFDKFLWDYHCSWHKKKKEQYKINPKVKYCVCNYAFNFNKFHKCLMLLFGGITIRCPRCNRKHRFVLYYNVCEEHEFTRTDNKELEKCRENLWNKS